MKIRIEEALSLVSDVMATYGYDAIQSHTIAHHLVDTELRGFGVGGLARAVTVAERLESSAPFRPITTIKETSSSLAIDGGDQAGYIVAKHLTERLIEKSRTSAAVVGTARNTWCTGMFTYYLEMLTSEGLAGFIASSGGPYVAPAGGVEAQFGTNPVAFGFPTSGDPVIWDIGTSSLMLADLTNAKRHDTSLDEGLAFDKNGRPTTDADSVLDGGALTTWGGHKGSGLAMSAQLLGIMAGSEIAPPWLTDMGFFMFAVDPSALSENFSSDASEFVERVRSTKPIDERNPVRIPFERSISMRSELTAEGQFEVEDLYVERLRSIRQRRSKE